jgi:hypothetical protein
MVLEKVVFTEARAFDDASALARAKHCRLWVNCPRRVWPGYEALRESLVGATYLGVTGESWGLACNAVHFIDLAVAMGLLDPRGSTPTVSTDGLVDGVIASKRAGYQEVEGTLVVRQGSHVLQLTSLAPSKRTMATERAALVARLEWMAPRGRVIVEEATGRVWGSRPGAARDSDAHAPFETWPVSRSTSTVVEALLTRDACTLPTLEDARWTHVPFLDAMRRHFGRAGLPSDAPLPIT